MKMITYTFADGTRAAVAVEDALYERYHRITAAEGESSDFHEGQEQFKILIHNITPTENYTK